jgi:hypothetical protein
VECLETRALLATSTASIATGFTAPDLSGLVRLAFEGKNTGPAAINTMQTALQSQLTNGVLTALQGGTLTPADFTTSVNNVVTAFEVNVDSQLGHFFNIDNILKGRGQAVQQGINALNVQLNDGLITTATYTTEAGSVINGLTGGPLFALHTPNSGFAQATSNLETQLKLLPPTLATGATPSLTLAQVQAIADADAEAYRAAMNASLFTRKNVSTLVDQAVNTFETSINGITSTDPTTQAAEVTAAITALDAALLDNTGLFGPNGAHKGK